MTTVSSHDESAVGELAARLLRTDMPADQVAGLMARFAAEVGVRKFKLPQSGAERTRAWSQRKRAGMLLGKIGRRG